MRQHLVHIGYHKTATTWFQRVYYPQVENARYLDRRTVIRALLEPSAFKFRAAEARQVLDEAAGPRAGRWILCEEGLSGYLHNGGLNGCLSKDMAYRLKAVLPEAAVVVFIRNQVDMIAACYHQYIRAGGTHGVDRYLWPRRYLTGALAQPHKAPLFSFDHFDYGDLLAHYCAVFGRENVHVFPYEAFRDDPAGFLHDYERLFGLHVDHARLGSQRPNPSYPLWIIHLARALNRFTRRSVLDKRTLVHVPYWYSLRRELIDALNRWRPSQRPVSSRALLGARNVDYIRQRYALGNRRLAEAYGLPLARYGYPTADMVAGG